MNNTGGLERFEYGDYVICERTVFMVTRDRTPWLAAVISNPPNPDRYRRIARGETILVEDTPYTIGMDYPVMVLRPITEDR